MLVETVFLTFLPVLEVLSVQKLSKGTTKDHEEEVPVREISQGDQQDPSFKISSTLVFSTEVGNHY